MKTLKIEIPKGYEIETFDEKKGEIKFKQISKNVTDRIKTFNDVLKELGIDKNEFHLNTFDDLSQDEIAYQKIKLICKALNEGWTPDWDNSNEYKYYPWFKMGSSGFRYHDYGLWFAVTDVGSRLCFKSRELAEYAGNQFTDIYKNFMTIT